MNKQQIDNIEVSKQLKYLLKNSNKIEVAKANVPQLIKLTTIYPDNASVYATLGTLLEKSKAPPQNILSTWEKASRLAPDNLSLFNSYMQALIKLGQTDIAETLFE